MPFEGVDYYDLDSLLTDEQKTIRDAVRQWVDERFMPIIADCYEEGRFPDEVIPELAGVGLLGPTFPEKYGCAGMDNISYGLIMQELERGDCGLRSFASVQSGLVMYPIFTWGSEKQKDHWLPRLATGEAIGCFGLTEPDYGSDPGGMITKARHRDGGFVLNGAKMWITNSPFADVAVVWAKLEDEDDNIRGFLVEKEREGYSAPEQHHKLSLRASCTGEIVLDDCFIPEENLLPKSGGLKCPLGCLTQARYGIAWGVIGSMMAIYDEALNYSKSRITFGKPIAAFQLTQAKLATILSEITKLQFLVFRLGQLKDEGKANHTRISLAKRACCETALEVARIGRGILGANGISGEYQTMRHMCNLESVITYEGTHEMHTLALGREITGIDAFR